MRPVSATRPCSLLVHGADDRAVSQQSRAFMDRLRASGVNAELFEIPGVGHSFVGTDQDTTPKPASSFGGRWCSWTKCCNRGADPYRPFVNPVADSTTSAVMRTAEPLPLRCEVQLDDDSLRVLPTKNCRGPRLPHLGLPEACAMPDQPFAHCLSAVKPGAADTQLRAWSQRVAIELYAFVEAPGADRVVVEVTIVTPGATCRRSTLVMLSELLPELATAAAKHCAARDLIRTTI